MRAIPELLSTQSGRDLLIENGIYSDTRQFVAALSRPSIRTLAGLEQDETSIPVYVHQQPAPDYPSSVVAKFEALAYLCRKSGSAIAPFFVAIDTDRAASNREATRIAWRNETGNTETFKTTPPGTKYLEYRNIRTDPSQLREVVRRLSLRAHECRSNDVADRLERITPLLAPSQAGQYSHYASEISSFLLQEHCGVAPTRLFVSALQDRAHFQAALERLLENLDTFRSEFNRQIRKLHSMHVATAVSQLPVDYLPLHFSCPVDGERTRLRRRQSKGQVFAETKTRAGRHYKISLSRGNSTAELFASQRVSVDVNLPVLLTRMFSGLIAGRSSALYCMVMAGAMKEALQEPMTPVLVPAVLANQDNVDRNLVQRWLVEGGS